MKIFFLKNFKNWFFFGNCSKIVKKSLFLEFFGNFSFLNWTLGLRKSFLYQTTYVLKCCLLKQSFLYQDSFLNVLSGKFGALLLNTYSLLLKVGMEHNNHALNLQPRYLHLLFAEPYRSTTKTFTCMGFSQLSMVSWVAWFSSSIHGQMKRFAGWDYVVLILLNTLRFSPMRETDNHRKLSN